MVSRENRGRVVRPARRWGVGVELCGPSIAEIRCANRWSQALIFTIVGELAPLGEIPLRESELTPMRGRLGVLCPGAAV